MNYSSYPRKETEVLDRTVQGILIEAIIDTETEKLWRSDRALSPEEVDKAYKDMEAKINEVLQG